MFSSSGTALPLVSSYMMSTTVVSVQRVWQIALSWELSKSPYNFTISTVLVVSASVTKHQFWLLQWRRLFVLPAFFFKASKTLKILFGFISLSTRWGGKSTLSALSILAFSCLQMNRSKWGFMLRSSRGWISFQRPNLLIDNTSFINHSLCTTLCIPNHQLISAATRFGIYWCHLQGVSLL
jgi:hypothetical protein